MDRWREELYEARVILWENTAMYDNRSKPEKKKIGQLYHVGDWILSI